MNFYNKFLSGLRHIHLPGENEKEHATIRFLVVVSVVAYINLPKLWTDPFVPFTVPEILVPLLFVAMSGLLLWLVTQKEQGSIFRLALNLVFDSFIISAGIFVSGAPGAVLYPVYFLMIFGYGKSYGPRTVAIATLLAIVGFDVATQYSSYWANMATLRVSLTFGIALVALYSGVLLFRLHLAREQADNASRRKSQFLASVGHEFRTPLNAIIGYSEMIAEELNDERNLALKHDLSNITVAGKHLLNLVDDLMDLSKIEAGKVEVVLQSFDIGEMISEVGRAILPIMKKNGNQLILNIDDRTGTMNSDYTKVKQCVMNLASNASKFTRDGKVEISARRIQYNGADQVLIQVRDTGIGMSEEQLKRVFDDFTQAGASTHQEYGGTGLGLSITRRLSHLLGGAVNATSTPAKGSTFSLRLPLNCPATGQ